MLVALVTTRPLGAAFGPPPLPLALLGGWLRHIVGVGLGAGTGTGTASSTTGLYQSKTKKSQMLCLTRLLGLPKHSL